MCQLHGGPRARGGDSHDKSASTSPDDAPLRPYQIKALHPFDFLLDQLDLYEEATKAVILGMVDIPSTRRSRHWPARCAGRARSLKFAAKARRIPVGSPFGLGVLLPFDQWLAAPSAGPTPHPVTIRQRDRSGAAGYHQHPTAVDGQVYLDPEDGRDPTSAATAASGNELDVVRVVAPSEAKPLRRPADPDHRSRPGSTPPAETGPTGRIHHKSVRHAAGDIELVVPPPGRFGEEGPDCSLPDLPLGWVGTVSRIQLRCRVAADARTTFLQARGSSLKTGASKPIVAGMSLTSTGSDIAPVPPVFTSTQRR